MDCVTKGNNAKASTHAKALQSEMTGLTVFSPSHHKGVGLGSQQKDWR